MPAPQKKVWVCAKRYDLIESGEPPSTVKDVIFTRDCPSADVHAAFRDAFDIKNDNVVLKLRNHRKSLITINGRLTTNTKSLPYTLEVSLIHQHSESHMSPAMEKPQQTDTMKKTLEDFINRIDQLEAAMPELEDRRKEKTEKEVKEMTHKLKFLDKRFTEAECIKWEGMFKKNPLW